MTDEQRAGEYEREGASVALFSDATMLLHDPGPMHPESSKRLEAVFARMNAEGRQVKAPVPATREALTRIHHTEYVDDILSRAGDSRSLDPDTHLSSRSVDAALLATGAAVEAVGAVTSGGTSVAAALCRPPGHHALADRAMGFCIFNNLAVGVEAALAHEDIQRVLVVDWDVHHGNGTEASFIDNGNVMVFDTHQSPFYPGSGSAKEVGHGAGLGLTHNVPLAEGATGGDLVEVFKSRLVPAAETFRPDLVVVAAGFDAHRHDPVGGLDVRTGDYAAMAAIVRAIAQTHCDGRIVLTLEGGYNPDALADSVSAVLEVLEGRGPPAASKTTHRARESIAAYDRARAELK